VYGWKKTYFKGGIMPNSQRTKEHIRAITSLFSLFSIASMLALFGDIWSTVVNLIYSDHTIMRILILILLVCSLTIMLVVFHALHIKSVNKGIKQFEEQEEIILRIRIQKNLESLSHRRLIK
jgi:uncharacterized membrane protein